MLKQSLLFLSHSGVDTENARELKRRIELSPSARRLGLKVWFDKDDLDAGKSWQRQLEHAIQKRCTAFAVYVGSRGVMNWVESEVSLGLSRASSDRSFPFIPILAQKSTASALPPFAALYQAVRDPLNDPAEMEKLLGAVLEPGEPVALLDEPFVGLRAMTESEADRFFGRAAEVEELVRKLEKSRLVAVVADSGSGKSSLVLAGLIPKFRGGAFADPARQEPTGRIWHVVTVRPGSAPFDNLRKAVITASERLALSPREKSELGELIDPSKPQQIAYALQCNLPAETTETLLVIDQFEELFTQTPERLRAPFIDWVLSLIGPGAVLGFRVVLTIRSDYFNLCSTHPVLFDLLKQDNVNFRLKQITAEGLAAIVHEPLRMAGHNDRGEQDALIAQIKRDVSDRPGDLALIQMALFETWNQHKLDNSSLLEAYARVGGISGALAHAAEKVRTEKLDPKHQGLLEPVFVRLINLGDTGGATRRVARTDEFDGSRRNLIKLLSMERYSRLLLLGTETVDICHEQLITQWPWLQSRITESAVHARRLGRLIEKVSEWNRGEGKDKNQYLATGAELEVFDNLAKQHGDWLSSSETEYVTASKDARQRDRDARQREERRRTWLFRGVAVASFLFAVAAAVAIIFYVSATEQTRIAVNHLDRANRALARGIWSDLAFDRDLGPRELNALWLLCSSDKSIRDRFVEELLTVRDNLLRFGIRSGAVARALGLDWPSQAEAQRTLNAVLQAMQETTKADYELERLAQAVQALASKLNDAQAQQALDAVLQVMQRTMDPRALQGLAQAVDVLTSKLTDAQAQQAVDALLQAMQKQNNRSEVRETMQTVADKLTDAQVQQSLDAALQAMQRTADELALDGLVQAVQVFAGKLSDAQPQQALDAILQAMPGATLAATRRRFPEGLFSLFRAVKTLPVRLTDAQAQQALDAVLQAGWTSSDLAEAVQALAGRLSVAQAQQAFEAILQAKRNEAIVFGGGLREEMRALADKLTDAQVKQALDAVLQAGTTSWVLADAVQALADKLSDAQAQQALDAVLQAMRTDEKALGRLAGAMQALPGKLTDAQAQQALDAVLHATQEPTTDEWGELGRVDGAMQALAGKLTDASQKQALDAVLQVAIQRMADVAAATTKTTPRPVNVLSPLRSLTQTIAALGGKLTDAQLNAILQAARATTDAMVLSELLDVLQVMGANLTDAQLDAVLLAMRGTTQGNALLGLVSAVQGVASKLTDTQTEQALDAVLRAMRGTTDDWREVKLRRLVQAVQALAGKLNDAQAQQALDAVLQAMQGVRDSTVFWGLTQAVHALTSKLTDAQAQQAVDALLKVTEEPLYNRELREAMQAVIDKLTDKLTDAQAKQALDSVLQAMRGTTDAYKHLSLAHVAQGLAGKLTDAQAHQLLATRHLQSAFGWSATAEESAAWAKVITTLLRSRDPNYINTIVELLKYPLAAGPATNILLEVLRVSGAPGANAGLRVNLRWLADTYPAIDLGRAPACPMPLSAGLACPSEP